MHPFSSMNRLNVTLSRLRNLGLKSVLEHSEDGYRIDPTVALRLE